MAPCDPPQRHRASLHQTVGSQRVDGVTGAGGLVTAVAAKERGEEPAIRAYETDQKAST
jgi:hypothetical protein